VSHVLPGAEEALTVATDLKTARQERAARNQSLFREVNERLEEAISKLQLFGEPSRSHSFVCECLNLDCSDQVPLTGVEYKQVRRASTHFLVAPGHDVAEVERVFERAGDRFVVVEKIEAAAKSAAKWDGRGGAERIG
jgi:hypothetical protein